VSRRASGSNAINEANATRGFGIYQITREQHLHRVLGRNDPGKGYPRRRTEEADIYPGRRKARGRIRHAEVAAGDELASSGCCDAFHNRDYGFRQLNDAGHQCAAARKGVLKECVSGV
jgi:hypothetical protein